MRDWVGKCFAFFSLNPFLNVWRNSEVVLAYVQHRRDLPGLRRVDRSKELSGRRDAVKALPRRRRLFASAVVTFFAESAEEVALDCLAALQTVHLVGRRQELTKQLLDLGVGPDRLPGTQAVVSGLTEWMAVHCPQNDRPVQFVGLEQGLAQLRSPRSRAPREFFGRGKDGLELPLDGRIGDDLSVSRCAEQQHAERSSHDAMLTVVGRGPTLIHRCGHRRLDCTPRPSAPRSGHVSPSPRATSRQDTNVVESPARLSPP